MGPPTDPRNEHGQEPVPLSRDREHGAALSARVRQDEGGWIVDIVLGDGATLSKWFPDAESARRYPTDLRSWLDGAANDRVARRESK